MKGFIYILQSTKNDQYYIGSSTDIISRLNNYHNKNLVLATKNRGPWIIKYRKEYSNIKLARKIENKLKKLKSRKITEQIIRDQNILIGV